ncbi:zinc-dependent metalloprotease [Chitinophaga sp. B61]|uniref:Zinc-dependent metalloprotease n=2 Tax=Chitinophaga rhizophila TaxID=2866212 RepID=A0ABS7G827_9BACT|nr:zinc-dependent metalloprotease [Chitinophaga rhizophila]
MSCLFSCKKEESESTSHTKVVDSQIAYLNSKGFKKENIEFKNGKFILDNDILINQDEVAARIKSEGTSDGPQTEHWRHRYIVSRTYQYDVRVYIDPAVPADWQTATQGAVTNWSTLGSGLGMSLVSTLFQAHTRVFAGYESGANWVARAYLPTSNGRPGVSIEINTYYNYLTPSEKLFAITHELGHTVGFNHTDQNVGFFITSGTPWIPDPPQVDPYSVMNSFILPWNGFTTGDVQATRILFPF